VPREISPEQVSRCGFGDRCYLFLGEPPVVKPGGYDVDAHSFFARILTWRDDLVDGDRYVKYHWPVPETHPAPSRITFEERSLLVNISANKSSSHPLELYSARMEVIRYCEVELPTQFALYGHGWESDPQVRQYKTYRGVVPNKWDVLGNYRFALCFENARQLPGYVTEKIFDCLRAGVVPVYRGAPNIDEYVDPDAFINGDRFSSPRDLMLHLLDVDATEFSRHREAATRYLRSERFQRHLPDAFCDTVLGAVGLDGATADATRTDVAHVIT
jgi:hypothetical protein